MSPIILTILALFPFYQQVEATEQANCVWAETAPTIDGKLDDACWKSAPKIDKFPTFWKQVKSGEGTVAKLVWDNDAIYFSGEMTDIELRSFGTKRNDLLWNGDVFELFFKPDLDKPAYYEFQVNPLSVILELPFPQRGSSFEKLAAKPPLGMTAVARCIGTLDTPGDTDERWLVEGKIPWTAFASTGGKPKVGDVWRFALCRYDYGKDGTAPILTSSAPLTKPSFHHFEDYGQLTFVGPGPSK